MIREKSLGKELEDLRAEAFMLEKAISRAVEEVETTLMLLREDMGRVYEYSKGELDEGELRDALLWIITACDDLIETASELKVLAEKLYQKL